MKYIIVQMMLAIVTLYFHRDHDVEPRNFLFFSLMTYGFAFCPSQTAKQIDRLVQPDEYRASIGSWTLQICTCLFLLFLLIPITNEWLLTVAIALVLSIILLLTASKREANKRSLPSVAE